MNRYRVLLLSLLVMATPGAASAQERFGFYLGGSLGQGEVDIGDGGTFGGVTASRTRDEKDTYYKLFAGYRFNRHLAVEGGFADFGEYSLSISRPSPAGNARVGIEASGWFLDAVGIIPFGNNFSAFGRLGAIRTNMETNLSASGSFVLTPGASPTTDDRETNLKWGIGVGFDFSRNLGLRLEYEQVKDVGDDASTGGDTDLKLWSLGLVYRF